MWRHVHDIFTAAGATNAIWIWSPSRVDPYPNIDLAPLYPGDDYVDWLGMTGYFRHVEQTPSFDRTFGKTLVALDEIAQKPILLSEVGATESGGNRDKKVAWIKDLFAGIKANPQIIGFAWFDQSVEGNDWRIESSSAATAAFADGVADPSFGAGGVAAPVARHDTASRPGVRDRFPGVGDGWARFDGPAGTQMVDTAIDAMRDYLERGDEREQRRPVRREHHHRRAGRVGTRRRSRRCSARTRTGSSSART